MSGEKWDRRFLRLAREVSTWSKDPSTQVGAVIVRPDRSVASLGFNGFPRVMYDNPEHLLNRDTKLSRIVHAEINAMIFAGAPIAGFSLYTWPFSPCDRCVVQMLQAGITDFIFPRLSEQHQRWAESLEKSKSYIVESYKSYREIATIE